MLWHLYWPLWRKLSAEFSDEIIFKIGEQLAKVQWYLFDTWWPIACYFCTNLYTVNETSTISTFFPTNTGRKKIWRQLDSSVLWNDDQLQINNSRQNNTARRRQALGVRSEVLQRTDAVLARQIALEVGLEQLETLAIHDTGAVSSNVEARRMRLVNDEGIRHDDKTEPTLTNSTTLGKLIDWVVVLRPIIIVIWPFYACVVWNTNIRHNWRSLVGRQPSDFHFFL